MGDKKFDVVVYGATGYTGKLVVDYMASNYGNAEDLRCYCWQERSET